MSLIPNQIIKGSIVIAILSLFVFGCSKGKETPALESEIDTIQIPDPLKEEIPDVYAGLDTTTYNDKPLLSGTFSGKLHYRGFNNKHIEVKGIQVTFKDNLYKCNLYGQGAYEIKSDRVILFRDSGFYHADFDWGIILSYNYRYFAKGDSLIMTKDLSYRDPSSSKNQYYQYRLKRNTSDK